MHRGVSSLVGDGLYDKSTATAALTISTSIRMQKFLSGLGKTGRTIVAMTFVLFIAAGAAQASTTISTNILTGGTLGVTGLSSLGQASSTMLSANSAYFGATATSSFSSAGALTLIADLTLQNGETISNSTNGTVSVGGASDVLKVLGTASTSALKVGDEPAAPTMNGLVFGYCSFSNVTLAASSTDGFANCTATPAGSLVAGDRVFVMATSSFDQAFVITAASTTDTSTIQLRIMNTGLGVADGTLGGTSINFWAVR